MRPLDPRLVKYASSARKFLVTTIALGVVGTLAVIAQAFILGDLLAKIFHQQASPQYVHKALLALLAVVCLRALTTWTTDVAAYRTSAHVKHQLRSKLIEKIGSLGPTWVTRHRTSDLLTSSLRGLDSLDVYFARYLPQLALAAFIPAGVLTAILINDRLSAAIVLITLPLIPLFMALIGWFTQAQVGQQWESLQRLSGHFLDLIHGLPTLKAFNRSRVQMKNLETVGEQYRATTMSVLRVSFLSAMVLELISTISVALVAVSIGLRLVSGGMELREGLIILILIPEAYLPLRNLGTQFHAMTEGVEASQQILNVLDIESTLPDHDDDMDVERDTSVFVAANRAPTITLSDVSVMYPPNTVPALDTFSASFHPGTITALIGPSGAGKTTILNVLAGFISDYSGEIFINEANMRNVDLTQWQSHITYLTQHPWLPQSSLRQILTLDKDVDDDQLLSACTGAGLDMLDFTNGLDTVVGRRSGVSTGQRRRIALARALLQAHPLVLLDEPTATVDSETERIITQTLRTLAERGALVLAVTHRAELIAQADNVIELHGALMQ